MHTHIHTYYIYIHTIWAERYETARYCSCILCLQTMHHFAPHCFVLHMFLCALCQIVFAYMYMSSLSACWMDTWVECKLFSIHGAQYMAIALTYVCFLCLKACWFCFLESRVLSCIRLFWAILIIMNINVVSCAICGKTCTRTHIRARAHIHIQALSLSLSLSLSHSLSLSLSHTHIHKRKWTTKHIHDMVKDYFVHIQKRRQRDTNIHKMHR